MKNIGTPFLAASMVGWLSIGALLACGEAVPAAEETDRATTEDITTKPEERIVGGEQTPAARIVNGKPTESGTRQWQVALMDMRGDIPKLHCGGTVIDPHWVLTAAHCVEKFSAEEIEVLAGTHDLSKDGQEEGQRIRVVAIVIHENFRTDIENSAIYFGYDIALLELERKADVGKIVALPDAKRPEAIDAAGVEATVIGWGWLHGEAYETTELLMEVVLPLVDEETCRDAYPDEHEKHGRPAINDRTLCAGLSEGGKDACHGDSGGPLVVRDGTEWVQIGIVSWGTGCAQRDRYGVYTRTKPFRKWVENEMTRCSRSESGCASP